MVRHLPIKVNIKKVNDGTACWLVQEGYITLYSSQRKTPLFAAQLMLKSDFSKKVVIMYNKPTTGHCFCQMTTLQLKLKRNKNKCFRMDPRLTEQQSTTCKAYEGKYTKGHIVPAGNHYIIAVSSF